MIKPPLVLSLIGDGINIGESRDQSVKCSFDMYLSNFDFKLLSFL